MFTPKIAVISARRSGAVNAIGEYSAHLTDALKELVGRADLVESCRSPGVPARRRWQIKNEVDGWREVTRDALVDYDAVVLQYNPFLYARWGFAPWLPLETARLKRGARRPTLALMVHEPYVPMTSWRWALLGSWQRAQLLLLRAASDVVLTSIEAWARDFGERYPRRPTFHLPVGSNLPDRRDQRRAKRETHGFDGDTVVLASLGTGHPARMFSYVVASANAVARSHRRVALLHLGVGVPPLEGLDPRIELWQPGFLEGDELAACLAAADIFVAPFVDGVSTRRGSVMAALQHGIAVVGTDGPLTDGMLRRADDAIRLTPVGRPELMSRAVAALGVAPNERDVLGKAGRALYERAFDWPVLARRLLDLLAGVAQ